MFRYLPSKVYAKLTDVIDNGAPLDRNSRRGCRRYEEMGG